MPVQQKQNIKGFSLIELLVVIAIISIIASIGFPNFSKWSRDREIRAQSEKIANLFTTATTQVERGAYPYVRVEFVSGSSPGEITVKGISQDLLSKKINGPIDPSCSVADFTTSSGYVVDEITSHTLNENTYIPILAPKAGVASTGSGGAICFSKGGKYFKQYGSTDIQGNIAFDKNTSQPTNNYVAVCHLKSAVCDPVTKIFDDNYPAYLVRYSRFGLITKYKWNNKTSDWSSQ
jgi:prepilin-type N-terminal cleavage/methylation domain-containing protein